MAPGMLALPDLNADIPSWNSLQGKKYKFPNISLKALPKMGN